VGIGVAGDGLAVGDAVGVGFVVGVGVGEGGVGKGMMKKTMLKTTIRLRTKKVIWRDLACDLREPRFTAYLLMGWQPVRDPFITVAPLLYRLYRNSGATMALSRHRRCRSLSGPNYTTALASMPRHSIPVMAPRIFL
jgi:hypothetical protein